MSEATAPTPHDPSPQAPLHERALPLDAVPRLSARARVQTDKVSGKPVLVSPECVVNLNATGAEILALCDGVRTFNDIATELAAQYNAPKETIAANVCGYLLKLREKNLVSW